MIAVKKDMVKSECELTIREAMLNCGIALRVAKETCGEDMSEWFAKVGKDTLDQIDGMSTEEFDEFMLKEKANI